MVRKLFQLIYCMNIWQIVLLMILITYSFLALEKRFCQRNTWKWFKLGATLTIVAAIIYTTLGNRDYSDEIVHALVLFHSYWEVWRGGSIEIYRSNFMNVVLFYPAGLLAMALLPGRWAWGRRCLLVVLPLAAMSVGIEFLQYRFALGQCEIDDVIHNTLGALLGSLAAMLPQILPRKS